MSKTEQDTQHPHRDGEQAQWADKAHKAENAGSASIYPESILHLSLNKNQKARAEHMTCALWQRQQITSDTAAIWKKLKGAWSEGGLGGCDPTSHPGVLAQQAAPLRVQHIQQLLAHDVHHLSVPHVLNGLTPC